MTTVYRIISPTRDEEQWTGPFLHADLAQAQLAVLNQAATASGTEPDWEVQSGELRWSDQRVQVEVRLVREAPDRHSERERFEADYWLAPATGVLRIERDEYTIAEYAAGQWHSVREVQP